MAPLVVLALLVLSGCTQYAGPGQPPARATTTQQAPGTHAASAVPTSTPAVSPPTSNTLISTTISSAPNSATRFNAPTYDLGDSWNYTVVMGANETTEKTVTAKGPITVNGTAYQAYRIESRRAGADVVEELDVRDLAFLRLSYSSNELGLPLEGQVAFNAPCRFLAYPLTLNKNWTIRCTAVETLNFLGDETTDSMTFNGTGRVVGTETVTFHNTTAQFLRVDLEYDVVDSDGTTPHQETYVLGGPVCGILEHVKDGEVDLVLSEVVGCPARDALDTT